MLVKLKTWTDKHLQGDPVIWVVVLCLSLISILVVYSATGSLAYKQMGGNTEYYLIRHTIMVGLAMVVMWVAHKIDYRYYSKITRYALFVSVPLLLYAWQAGSTVNEASRWIELPFIGLQFQPSDLAKMALIAGLASMLAKRQQNIANIKESLIPMLAWCGAICGLIAMTNISTAILLFLTCMLLLFIGRVPPKYLAMLVVVGAFVGVLAMSFGQRGGTAISRVTDFISQEEVPYQAQQSYIAIATGGVIGKGPGKSDQRNFLPYPYSDFVYAIIIEEYGMIGGVFVLFLYLVLLYRGMRVMANSDRAFGGLLSAGLSFAIVIQALVNIGVVVGLGPVTGQTLPLISMGGTSLLFTGLSLGIILSVSRGEQESFSPINGDLRNTAKA
ncbi:cell division protein FtsW [Roseivirga ehrenbergii]|uniref:Probable peptidoglycan glycosyltransferase FtsW n=3 Tax=Roseivirga TaxID=290180 RepID=A0A0L8AGX6_9BACT|nr:MULTISPECIES: FtsW/RodA/SpoVE family cell cycle protein [Roseivirga]KOF01507.1 cell division protein FtsW [Roseivirga seohaensis subsp. aquiponti]KYG79595.1 cell division protein FtsW [Roseivirga ehrenbergii]KYG85643.1 cell division protein FtsW [Roseivirga seohaensis]TCL01071.1 cell division protein FtsW [Roseivirga ehrenbergii]